MSVLEGVLLEEIARLERKIAGYEQLLLSLPRGTIFVRKMGGSSFAYRKKKENGRVFSEYLGNIKDDGVQKEIKLSEEYKRIRLNLKSAEDELATLRKAHKTYERQRTTTPKNT